MRPRFTLALLYFLGFFFVYCFALVAPALWDVLVDMPPGPAQQHEAERVAQEAARGKIGLALVAAIATVGLGAWRGLLPGTRN